jgi:methyl-accepting chemotaxis protein
MQTRDTLGQLLMRGHGFASTFSQIAQSVASNRQSASRELLAAAQSVGQVTSMVSAIANAVKLLSLNATIEAARAGEAGRGFVVVAQEIRKLSEDAKQATQVISAQLQHLKNGIEAVSTDYRQLEAAMSAIAAGSAQIDTALSSQADTALLVATSVSEAGEASSTIESSASRIVSSVRSASTSARELDGTAQSLRSGAFALGRSVEALLGEVCAA